MSPNSSVIGRHSGSKRAAGLVVLFLLVAIAGLLYVKWWPYYFKMIKAATDHSIGSSILTGGEAKAPAPSWDAAWDYAVAYFKSVWQAAVLGILLGTLVQVLLPSKWLLRVLGRMSLKSTAIGGLAAIPGMMCTCCAAPIAVGLRKKNVSVGASLAFWIGNPTLNPATLIFMTFVLSWKFTLIRLVFGLLLTFGVSYFANRFSGETQLPEAIADKLEQPAAKPEPLAVRWLKSVWSMFLHVVPAYLVVVLLLGAVRAWLFPSFGDGSFGGIAAIVLFALAGTLFVIPTAAEIPIIQSFLSIGVGAGAAAALLVTLPAVSLPSLLMVSRSFPRKVIGLLVGSVVAAGILSGIAGAFIL
ncbi:permease [Cohnella zeiphila]|uniref:Permease n=1 Tax=Cohnella zeiphila TaxID=2761120 RepID=A0A7X0SGC8_9BACL|nr:permease [Cohnella zeiphila]MBB6729466.1 permease [Cohnella zeiphila]